MRMLLFVPCRCSPIQFYREDEEEHNTVKMKRHFQLMSRASIAASKVKEELAELRVKVCDQEKEILELKAAQVSLSLVCVFFFWKLNFNV